MGARRRTHALADHAKLGSILKSARPKAGVTQQRLADAMGQPQSYVARIESGERQVLALELIQACRVLGVDVSEIVAAFESE